MTSTVLGGATGVKVQKQVEGAHSAETYQMGSCIVTPEARLVPQSTGKSGRIMYHGRRELDGAAGPECSLKDRSGLCAGHPMAREDFITLFCDGKEPVKIG